MPRQAFGDFLNGSPAAGRGGRGNGTPQRGGRGGGRGGRGGYSKQDYSAVPPVDYDAINKQTYKQMDGFAPSPYSANGSKGVPAPSPFRGKGKSRGASHGSSTPSRNIQDTQFAARDSPSGSGTATPHFGIGFGRGRGAWNPIASAMRGSGGGGRSSSRGTGRLRGVMADLEAADRRNMMAPVFVKAGSLFTEEEDIKGDPIEDSVPVREDDIGVEAVFENLDSATGARNRSSAAPLPEELTSAEFVVAVPNAGIEGEEPEAIVIEHEETTVVIPGDASGTDLMLSRTMDEVRIADDSIEFEDDTAAFEDPGPLPLVAEEASNVPLYFMDDGSSKANVAADEILFDVSSSAIIGERESSDEEEEEEVILVPRKFAKPEPISMPKEGTSTRSQPSAGHDKSGKNQNQGPQYMSMPFAGRPVATKSDKSKMHGKTKQSQKKQGRKARREGRIRKTEGLPRIGDSDIDWGSDGPPAAAREASDLEDSEEDEVPAFAGLGSRVRRDEQAIMQDYVQNAFSKPAGDSESADDDGIDMDALARFADGMRNPRHVTLDDVADQKKHQQEDEDEGWVDSSGSELSDEADEDEDEEDAVAPPNMVEIAPGLFAEVSADGESEEEVELELDEDDESSDDEMNGVQWVEEESEDEDDDLENDFKDDYDQMFKGKNTWATSAEDYIAQLEAALDAEDVMGTGSRKSRNKLFKSIHNGDFGDDWDLAPAPKGKKAKMKGVPKELQSQWEKDRQKKAEKKRQRELDRIEVAMSLYPASKRGKGKGKKGKPRFGFDDSDEDEDMTPRRKKGIQPVTDLGSLNQEIRAFLMDLGKTTMTLPPMEKFSRKRVHELAACYSLKSQSKGKGRGRFPILIKTSYSSLQVNEHKVNSIVGSNTPGKFYKAKYGGNAGKGPKMPGGAGRTGPAVRHQEGDAVGGGASAIGSENIGHKLLSMMGWSEGDRIGRSGGLEAPIVAIVKTTKLGLGA